MRHTHYNRLCLDTDQLDVLPFIPEHFRERGIPSTPMVGMHELEALMLLNKWNRAQHRVRYVYFI